jgi:hypothetical protein
MSWNRKKQEALKHSSKHSSHKNRRNQTFNRESYSPCKDKYYDEFEDTTYAMKIVSDCI